MAKAGVEMALWDLYAKIRGLPLWKLLGGKRIKIPAGISLGIQDSVDKLLTRIDEAIEKGYQRIKIKIKPGWDVDVVSKVRKEFGKINLMVDANAAYNLGDKKHLRKLDRFDLMMIEQPLDYDDIIDHAKLQRHLKTPICLDESIKSPQDARKSIETGACRVVNIKQVRVGGTTNAIKVHNICHAAKIPVWCGGLLESGIGRLHNVALATLKNFTLPGDISASERYYKEDVIEPPVVVNKDGTIAVPQTPGIGHSVKKKTVRKFAKFIKKMF
jgi:O-succinylbenzoate synthase